MRLYGVFLLLLLFIPQASKQQCEYVLTQLEPPIVEQVCW